MCREGGGAATWSHVSRPGITNMPGAWNHLTPRPWAGQRNEIWVSSTAVKTGWAWWFWSQLLVLGPLVIRVWDM